MTERLTNLDLIEAAGRRIRELIEARGEWFYAPGEGKALLALRRSDMKVRVAQGRLIFTCWTEQGVHSWRIRSWQWTGEKLLLEAARRAGAERRVIELIPRLSTSAANAVASAARHARAERLARLLCSSCAAGTSVHRVALSTGARVSEPGRYARIEMRLRRERIFAASVVTSPEAYDVDAFLSSTLLWFLGRREASRSPSKRKLWLITDHGHIAALGQRLALLGRELRASISLFEIDGEWRELKAAPVPELAELWAAQRRARFHPPAFEEPGRSAARIVRLAPEAIDAVRARRGETLRYLGLPFARVRRVMGEERVWFGVGGAPARRLLDESTAPDWAHLLQQLAEHRRAGAPDTRHALYRHAPEAWLESMLRRDITRLDPGLRLAPLRAQFRASQAESSKGSAPRPVDLLALRHDGRLVVIELKVSEDREHVLQGADYWRRVEAHRQNGNLARARLFGDQGIAEEPTLVYLVAPTLSFHRAFQTLAHAIDPRIEIYRFDLNEDWRAGIRVMRRTRVT